MSTPSKSTQNSWKTEGGQDYIQLVSETGTIQSWIDSTGTGQGKLAAVTTVASGTLALGTALINSGAASTIQSVAAAGVLSTDNIMADFSSDPSGVTGYAPSANGMLTIIKFPTNGFVNFYVYNNTGSGITPGAISINWKVLR